MATRKRTTPGVAATNVEAALNAKLDALMKAVNPPRHLREPPFGFVSADQFAAKAGLSHTTAKRHLSDAFKAKKIERVTVLVGSSIVNFYGVA